MHAPRRALPKRLPQQTDFWTMHEYLFEHQHALEDADVKRYAAELGRSPIASLATGSHHKLKPASIGIWPVACAAESRVRPRSM